MNVDNRLQEAYDGGKENPAIQDLIAVAETMRQICPIIYYVDACVVTRAAILARRIDAAATPAW